MLRLIGVGALKVVSGGRYRSRGDAPDELPEGTLGLLIVAGVLATIYFLTGRLQVL